MMGHKERLINGDEWDAIAKAPLCVFYNNTGLKKYVKRTINKRIRRSAKIEVSQMLAECQNFEKEVTYGN